MTVPENTMAGAKDAQHVRLQRAADRLQTLSVTDWRAGLAKKKDGFHGDERNVLLALRLAPELKDLVRYNEFSLNVEFFNPPPWRSAVEGDAWTDDDDLHCQVWLQDRAIEVRQRCVVADSVAAIAKEVSVHPVRMYLRRLEWDGRPRIDHWIADFLGATEPEAYLTAVGSRWLIGAVARVERPGCQVDHVLVLEGPQGIGKSQTARILSVAPEWFADDVPDIHSKDAALQLVGRWIIELAELAAMRRAEIEGVKAFITRTQDVFRPPYARRSITVPRQSSFIATTNESQYLRDPTGNRRFWPVRCTAIDVEALAKNRDQMWAEAFARFEKGEPWHLTQQEADLAAAEQGHRVLVTEVEAAVAEYLAKVLAQNVKEIDAKSVMVHALQLDPDAADFAERATRIGAQVASAMDRAGWRKVKRQGRGETRRTTYVYQDSPR